MRHKGYQCVSTGVQEKNKNLKRKRQRKKNAIQEARRKEKMQHNSPGLMPSCRSEYTLVKLCFHFFLPFLKFFKHHEEQKKSFSSS
mmetsp:Transcript_17474/g.19746  ORF Transcript_17474/g.19746 Transcript_17474/m.19746 type:complete len:86 (-) Transcript_17474:514-771(-)